MDARSRNGLTLILVFALFVPLSRATPAADRVEFESAWQRIMTDLEVMIRKYNTAGPGISQTFEEYGIEASSVAKELEKNVTPALRAEFDLYAQNQAFKGMQDVYIEDFERTISLDEFDRKMWTQFETSFNREVRSLNSNARGMLMAQFTSNWKLRAPTIRPLVFYAWFGQSKVSTRVSKLATKLIWRTGNPTAIQGFIPQLMTNRMGGFPDSDGTRNAMDPTRKMEPFSELAGWQKKFPIERERAIQNFRESVATGDLKKSALFDGERGKVIWHSTPQHEIDRYIADGFARGGATAACPSSFSALIK